MSNFNPSRRRFIKSAVIAGVSVYLAPLYSRAYAALFEQKILQSPNWDPQTKRVRFRIDGRAKVMGQKVFARDIRAVDMPHWPQKQAHAFILRVTKADRLFEGVDLSLLGDDLQPDRLVTAEDLARDGLAFPAFYGDDMLLPSGKTPAYLGQAVAILIYHDFARFRFAKDKLKFREETIKYGAVTGPLERDPWGSFRYVRVGGDQPFDDDRFSSLKDTPIFPVSMKKHLPVWPEGREGGKLDQEGMRYAGLIADEMANPPADWLVMSRRYTTQSIDTSALEPDNANGWFDAETQTLHLVVPTQSPQEVADEMPRMLAKRNPSVKQLILHPCYTVGYGSKDHYNFPYYGAVAAMYGDGHPVRLANDRFEQFQTALKRHAFDMNYRIAVDRQTGVMQSFLGDMTADGGGRSNFTPSVVMVGATAAQSIYYFPKSDLSSVGLASRAIDAGSARGYGTLQSMAATEMMVDELAAELKIDPIEFRLRNVLKSGMKNTQGAIPAGAIRADEVLEKAAKHEMWLKRAERKAEFESRHPGKRYGVGFGCVQKDFGTGAETSFARVELSEDGRITLHHSGAEMGTGMSTSQSVLCAQWLGKPADEAHFSVTDWSVLPMVTSGDPYLMSQAEQDKLQTNPNWTPSYCSPSSASNSAYYFSHSTREAARLIFDRGLWPAAMALWQAGIGGGQAAPLVVRREDARWVEGGLTAAGMSVLSLELLAKTAYQMGGVTGAAVHVFNRWQWAEADFTLNGKSERLPIDGMALRNAGGEFKPLARGQVYYPPTQRNNAAVTYYSAVGTLAEVAVDIATGQVELLNHHSIMECGNLIVPELVSGQLQGGLAMGIGHALHEYLPLYEDGPGNGTWNFNRYHLPRASDVAVWKQSGDILPALSETDPPKGMAEVVMIPIVAALVNAIADATGHRFRDLPVRAENIREVLQ
ncbi:molybdopterin cofactor-binding domain-containing protein [Serratia marcescens]|uniref:xanthine dehydrogenase family protein molybdopterin-binding subunit n=1 Tax=Serratia marcescens TaxID=615 RepID=UPI001DC1E93C|nr:molybdopterin cofactor-binding domain-containing protein [Serratia marcescens]MBN5188376.1 xanthine dehydrogenase family protein molybdopterin-binding subunit [Serratia marcescens]MBN5197353.1 xanthine dehydrogenase family protein molybdopterin-binding subunit [Serratia marcescens]WVJ41300.1 molybdopterin cofactor-binding domain-containing protein [Serratia marcescens]BEO24965.1 oxidoreductase [Serratia marcescens]